MPVVTAGPPGPAWARKLLGDDFFADVVDMDYGPPGMYGPVGLGNLGWESTPITDAWLEHIGKLRGLTSLDLSGAQVSDVGLEKVGGLTRLRILGLAVRGPSAGGTATS